MAMAACSSILTAVIDGSPYAECIARLHEAGFFDGGKIHIIDPNTRLVIPMNPLARVHSMDPSVIADALLKAFEVVWGAEDTHQKPTIRTVLRSTFMALTEINLGLSHIKLLYDPDDPAGLRARVISQLTNEYARDELSRIHQVALADRSKRDFNALTVGPINRIAEFVSSDAVSAMFSVVDEPGKPRRTLDLLDVMNNGDFVFVNCSHGEAFSEANASLLGSILIRYLTLLAPRRTNREPFFVTIDEAHRYMVGDDLPSLFTESRKHSIGMHVCLQFEAQAGPRDELTAQALENCTEVKTVFRVKGAEEAQRHAHNNIPLTLERPVKASIRPTVVGHRKVELASRSSAKHQAITDGEAETDAVSHSTTSSHSRSVADGTSSSQMTGAGEFSATGENAGAVFTPALATLRQCTERRPRARVSPDGKHGQQRIAWILDANRIDERHLACRKRGLGRSGDARNLTRFNTQPLAYERNKRDTGHDRGLRGHLRQSSDDVPLEGKRVVFRRRNDPPVADGPMLCVVPRQDHPHHRPSAQEEVMINDPRSLAARLIAASPLAMSLEDALKQKRERRAELLAAPPVPEVTIAPEPLPVIDSPADYARDFWQDRQPPEKSPRRPPRKKSGSPHERRGPFRLIDGGKSGDKPT